MPDKKIVLEMREISKNFPGVKALDKVSIEVGKGEILGLLGENGAGKSTLIKILSGAYSMESGLIKIDGVDREMAECASCNYGIYGHSSPFPVQQENSEQTANKGSFKKLAKLEVSMGKNLVEETVLEAGGVEVEPAEVEITARVEEVMEFEQEIELPVLDLADAIAQDDQALRTVAMALVKVPEFIQAISEAVGSQASPHILEVTEAVPLKAKIVIVPGQRSETRKEQVAQPVNRPVAVQQAATAPVALPQQNGAGQKRKPSALDLLPPSQ